MIEQIAPSDRWQVLVKEYKTVYKKTRRKKLREKLRGEKASIAIKSLLIFFSFSLRVTYSNFVEK